MSDNKELLPCPFCGGSNLNNISYGMICSYYECNDCGASGPGADHSADEHEYWNRRAAQPVVLTDEQYEAIRHASALLELEGYTEQSADLVAILAAKEQA